MTRPKQTDLYSMAAIAEMEGASYHGLMNIAAKHAQKGDTLFIWRGWQVIRDGKQKWLAHRHTYPVVIHSVEDIKKPK